MLPLQIEPFVGAARLGSICRGGSKKKMALLQIIFIVVPHYIADRRNAVGTPYMQFKGKHAHSCAQVHHNIMVKSLCPHSCPPATPIFWSPATVHQTKLSMWSPRV